MAKIPTLQNLERLLPEDLTIELWPRCLTPCRLSQKLVEAKCTVGTCWLCSADGHHCSVVKTFDIWPWQQPMKMYYGWGISVSCDVWMITAINESIVWYREHYLWTDVSYIVDSASHQWMLLTDTGCGGTYTNWFPVERLYCLQIQIDFPTASGIGKLQNLSNIR